MLNRIFRLSESLLRSVRVSSSSIRWEVELRLSDELLSNEKSVMAKKEFFPRRTLVRLERFAERALERDSPEFSSVRRA